MNVKRCAASWVLAAAAVLVVGCSTTPPPEAPPEALPDAESRERSHGAAEESQAGPASGDDGTATGSAAEAEESAAEDAVEDRVWYVDEETGARYFHLRVPKVEGRYRWVNDTMIRLPRGMYFEVVEETDDEFVVKRFVLNESDPDPGDVASQGSAEDGENRAWADRDRPPAEPPPVEVDRLRFQSFGAGLPASGQWRNGFEVVDFNGDGHLDIVHGPPRKAGAWPRIYLGDGAGSWRLWSEIELPEGLSLDYGDVAVADFDQDGILDLALAVHLRGLVVLAHDGEGGFSRWDEGLDYRQPNRDEGRPSFSSRAVEATDWDGDGLPDLVALSEGPGASPRLTEITPTSRGVGVFLNGGDGTWRRLEVETAPSLMGESLAVGDLDGDGHPEYASGTLVAGADTLIGFGRGGDGFVPAELPGLPANAFVTAVEMGDLDGDGTPELIVAHLHADDEGVWWIGVDAFDPGPERSWTRNRILDAKGVQGVWALATGDVDADGGADLLALTGDGGAWLFLADGRGGYQRQEASELAGEDGCRGYAARLVDLDGEPGDEIVLTFAGEPGTEILYGAVPGCPSSGQMSAWKAVPQRGG